MRMVVLAEMEFETTVVTARLGFRENFAKIWLIFAVPFHVPMVVPALILMELILHVLVHQDFKAKIVPSISMNVNQIHASIKGYVQIA